MLNVNILENRAMNIYARIRKVINIYKIWKKKRKKFLERLTTPATLPVPSLPPHLFENRHDAFEYKTEHDCNKRPRKQIFNLESRICSLNFAAYAL